MSSTSEEHVHDSEWLRAKVEQLPSDGSEVWFSATNADDPNHCAFCRQAHARHNNLHHL